LVTSCDKENLEKIVLVSPISHTHYVVPPIGLGYLATALRKSNFTNITILDCVKERLAFSSLRKLFTDLKPGIVGFQLFSYDFDSVIKSIEIVKQLNKQTIVIVGGAHVSATSTTTLEEIKEADFAFAGEGEIGRDGTWPRARNHGQGRKRQPGDPPQRASREGFRPAQPLELGLGGEPPPACRRLSGSIRSIRHLGQNRQRMEVQPAGRPIFQRCAAADHGGPLRREGVKFAASGRQGFKVDASERRKDFRNQVVVCGKGIGGAGEAGGGKLANVG